MITTLHAGQDPQLGQLLQGMVEVTDLVKLEDVLGLSPALSLLTVIKIRRSIIAGLQSLEKMVRLVMHQPGPLAQEGIPGVQPDPVRDHTGPC